MLTHSPRQAHVWLIFNVRQRYGCVRSLSLALKVFAVIGVMAIGSICCYAALASSGHTGWEPLIALALFVPLAIAGAALVKKVGPPAIFACAVGFAGIALVVYLDQTNRLVKYERWVKRGMP